MISPINGAVCESKKGHKGWNKQDVLHYSMLKRYSLAYLLRIMRSSNSKLEAKKFKIALEVVGKDIGKQAAQASQTTSYVLLEVHQAGATFDPPIEIEMLDAEKDNDRGISQE